MKKIMIIWGIITFALVGGLTVYGFTVKKENAPYQELEKTLRKKAEALVGENPSILNETKTITYDIFKENNYEINMIVNSDKCDGYVIVNKQMNAFKYEPYINCSKYHTNGYNKSLNN